MSQRVQPTATIVIDGATKVIADGNLTLDVAAVPYATATVELDLAQLTQAQIDWLDPTTGARPVITLDTTYPVVADRVLDMGLRERRVDAAGRRITLRLASDEALLMDYAPLADNDSTVFYQSSARDLTEYVMSVALPGSPTLGGTGDADLTPFWELTNFIPNPSVVGTTFGYAASNNTSAVDYSTAVGGAGGTSSAVRWTASATADSRLSAGNYTATEGIYYTASCYVRSATTARSMRMLMIFKDASGANIATRYGSTVTDTTTDWSTRISITTKAPQGTASVSVGVAAVTSTNPQFHYADLFMFHETMLPSTVQDYFDGTIAPTGYTTAWEDGSSTSQSNRIPDVDRPMEALIWQAGQTAWDFLMPLLASVNLVLWCTDGGDWFLDEPADRASGVTFTANGDTAGAGDEAISIDDRDSNVDGVVVRYVWIEQRTGNTRRKTETAGTAGNVVVIDLAHAYPGPGTAAAVLARQSGTGKSQSADVILDYTAQTGYVLQYVLPGYGTGTGTLGQITSIDFNMRGPFMRLVAAGVVD